MTTLLVDARPDTCSGEPGRATGRRPLRHGFLQPLLEGRRRESVVIFLGFAAVYTVLGQWLVREAHVVGFETLDRFHRALLLTLDPARGPATLSDDPAPLSTVITAPFTLVPGLLRAFAVVPVVSAGFAAATMVVLNTLMRRAGLGTATRVVGVLAVGFNPLVLLYAADGDRLFIGLCFALGALSSLLAWHATSDVRFVLAAGLAFGLAVLCDYDVLAWLVITVITLSATLVRLGAAGDEIRSTMVALTLPTVTALGLWVVFGLAVTGRPFSWLAALGRDPLGRPPTGDRLPVSEALEHTGSLVLHGAPLVLLVLPALLYAWLVRRDGLAGVLAAVLTTVALLPGVWATLGRSGPPLLRDAVPILLVGIVGAAWLAAGRDAARGPSAVGLVALLVLVLSVPWTLRSMTSYDEQVLEARFVDALRTGRSQEGTLTAGGDQVGYASEAAMARFVRSHVDTPGAVLTDGAATYAVLVRAAAPDLFRDRLRTTPASWQRLASDPAEQGVSFLLLSTDPRSDRLSRLYPAAAAGTDPRLTVSYRTPRYVLVQVSPDDGRTEDPGGPDEAEGTP